VLTVTNSLIDKALPIQGWMTPLELGWLAKQASQHSRIVEVGSFLGRSTRALADNTPGWVMAFDDWHGPRDAGINIQGENLEFTQLPEKHGFNFFEMFIQNLREHIDSGKVKVLCADHGDPDILPVEFLRGSDSEKPDMVFLDGHHGYEAVKRDLLIWKARLAEGGLLCGHDLDFDGVWRAVTEEFRSSWMSVPYTNLWLIRTA